MATLLALLNSIPYPIAFHGGLGDLFERTSESVAASVFTALWQSALLAAVLAALLKCAPRTKASTRFALWSTAFLASILLPLLRAFPLPWSAQAASPITVLPAPSAWLQLDARWSLAVGALWIAVSLYRAVSLTAHSFRLRKLWKSATRVEATEIVAMAKLSRSAQICTTAELDRPGVIGFFSPRILIPEWLYAQLSESELKQIVLHELEHLRRGDDWTNLAQKLSLVLFPLNPVLIWMEHRLCLEREMACDQGVIEATHAPRAYATCLTRLAERGIQHRREALSLGAWQRRPELASRIHTILRSKHVLSPRGTQALIAGFACSLVLGFAGFSRAPQLVAFVPPPTMAASRIAASPFETARMAGSPYASMDLAGSALEASVKPRMTEVRAIMPAPGRPAFEAVRKPIIASRQPRPHVPSPRAVEVAAQPAAPAFVETGLVQSQEQWIVLTTWQTQPLPNFRGDAEQSNDQPEPAAIVTQLVFRVITPRPVESPANPNAQSVARPANLVSLPSRAGWLIFQL